MGVWETRQEGIHGRAVGLFSDFQERLGDPGSSDADEEDLPRFGSLGSLRFIEMAADMECAQAFLIFLSPCRPSFRNFQFVLLYPRVLVPWCFMMHLWHIGVARLFSVFVSMMWSFTLFTISSICFCHVSYSCLCLSVYVLLASKSDWLYRAMLKGVMVQNIGVACFFLMVSAHTAKSRFMSVIVFAMVPVYMHSL